jgi:hypothetical protein
VAAQDVLVAASQATAAGAVTAGAVALFVLLLGSLLLWNNPSRPRPRRAA